MLYSTLVSRQWICIYIYIYVEVCRIAVTVKKRILFIWTPPKVAPQKLRFFSENINGHFVSLSFFWLPQPDLLAQCSHFSLQFSSVNCLDLGIWRTINNEMDWHDFLCYFGCLLSSTITTESNQSKPFLMRSTRFLPSNHTDNLMAFHSFYTDINSSRAYKPSILQRILAHLRFCSGESFHSRLQDYVRRGPFQGP